MAGQDDLELAKETTETETETEREMEMETRRVYLMLPLARSGLDLVCQSPSRSRMIQRLLEIDWHSDEILRSVSVDGLVLAPYW